MNELMLAWNNLTGDLAPLAAMAPLELLSLSWNSTFRSPPLPSCSHALSVSQGGYAAWYAGLSGPLQPLSALSLLRALSINNNGLWGGLEPVAAMTRMVAQQHDQTCLFCVLLCEWMDGGMGWGCRRSSCFIRIA
jgi:hypothetical protein